jgi:hypothetical protein
MSPCQSKTQRGDDFLMPIAALRSLSSQVAATLKQVEHGLEAEEFFPGPLPNGAIILASGSPPVCHAGQEEIPLAHVASRWLMTLLEIVGGIFGLFAVVLIVLLIYRSTLTMHEDDQLFLDEANSHMQEEQTELLVKVNRLTLPVRVFSIGSGVFLLAFLAMLIYQKLSEVQ